MPFAIVERLASLRRSAGSAVKTLRFRLMIWNAGLVLAAAMACFIGVREGLRRTLISGMDDVLTADVREVSLDVADLHTTAADLRAAAETKGSSPAALLLEALNRKESVHQHNGWFVELLDGDDRRLWASDLTPKLAATDRVRHELVPVSWNGYRVVEEKQLAVRGRALWIRVGAPMDFIDRDIASIDALAERGVALLLVSCARGGILACGPGGPPVGRHHQSDGRPASQPHGGTAADRSNRRRTGPALADRQPVSRSHRRLPESEQRPLGELRS